MKPTAKKIPKDEERKLAGSVGKSSWQQAGATILTGMHQQKPAAQHQHVSHMARAAQMMAAATVGVPRTANAPTAISAHPSRVNVDKVNVLTAPGRQDLMPFLIPRPSPSHTSQSSSVEPPNVSAPSPSTVGLSQTNQPHTVLADSKKQLKSQCTSSDAASLNSSNSGKKSTESKLLEIPPLGAPLPSMTDMLLLDIPTTFIHPHDVLCGRGGGTNNHSGNEQFRALVNSKKVEYLHSIKREKPRVSRGIVRAVRNQNPPGRFLQKNEKTGLWYDIGDQKAQEKTSQALRERAPELRREITDALGAGPPRGALVPVHTLSYRGVPNIAATRAAARPQVNPKPLENGSVPTGTAPAPGFTLHVAQAAVAAQQAAAAQRAVSHQQASSGCVDHYEQLRFQAAARARANHAAFAMQNHQKQLVMRQQAAAAIAVAQAAPGSMRNQSMLRNVAQPHSTIQPQHPPSFRENLARAHETGNEIAASSVPQPGSLGVRRADILGNEKRVTLNSCNTDVGVGSASSRTESASVHTTSLIKNVGKFKADRDEASSRNWDQAERKSSPRSFVRGIKRDHDGEGSLPIDCVRRLNLAEILAKKTANGTVTDEQKNEEYRVSLYMDAGLLGIEPCDLVKGLSEGKTESDLVEERYDRYDKKRKINALIPPLKRCHKTPGALEGLGALTKIGIENALSTIGAAN